MIRYSVRRVSLPLAVAAVVGGCSGNSNNPGSTLTDAGGVGATTDGGSHSSSTGGASTIAGGGSHSSNTGGASAGGNGGNTPGAPAIAGCQIFPSDNIFNTHIDGLPADHSWDGYMSGLAVNLHPDFGTSEDMNSGEYYGIPYNTGDDTTLVWKSIPVNQQSGSWGEVDCGNADHSPNIGCVGVNTAYYPIPQNPLVEGGLHGAVDHHMLVIDSSTCLLWEFYTSDDPNGSWPTVPGVIFDLKSNALRPQDYTSADAAGLPILPLLARAEEASTGQINHALRFTVNSTRRAYVWPARHYASSNTSASVPPMGLLLRIKASYQIPTSFGTQSRAILQAMKTYGMYLADNGSDMYFQGNPSAAWEARTFTEMKSVSSSIFEAVDLSSIESRTGWNVDSGRVPPP